MKPLYFLFAFLTLSFFLTTEAEARRCRGGGCRGGCSGPSCGMPMGGCSGAGCRSGGCTGAGCRSGGCLGAGCRSGGCIGAGCSSGGCSGGGCRSSNSFGQDLLLDDSGNLSGFSSALGAGIGASDLSSSGFSSDGTVDPTIGLSGSGLSSNGLEEQGLSTAIPQTATTSGHISGNEAQIFGNTYKEMVNGVLRNMGISRGANELVIDPVTGQRVPSQAGQLIVDSGKVARNNRGQRFTIYQPASLESVNKIKKDYEGDANNPLKKQVLDYYNKNGTGEGTAVPIGGVDQSGVSADSHTGPASPGGTSPRPIASTQEKTAYERWDNLWNKTAKDVGKGTPDQVAAFADKAVPGAQNTKVRVLHQKCASQTRDAQNTEKDITLYVFSTQEGGETKNHIVIKPVEETVNDANIRAAWDLAKLQDVEKDGTTSRDLGKAYMSNDPSALAAWFTPDASVTEKWPNIGESQILLRPVVGPPGIQDFATKYVFKDKQDLQDSTPDSHWKSNHSRDFTFYCKTTSAGAPAPTPAEEPTPIRQKSDVAPLAQQTADIINPRCVSCHREDYANGDLRLDTPELIAQNMDSIVENVNSNHMPLGAENDESKQLSSQEKETLRAYAQALKN